jgi:hypothetical protein
MKPFPVLYLQAFVLYLGASNACPLGSRLSSSCISAPFMFTLTPHFIYNCSAAHPTLKLPRHLLPQIQRLFAYQVGNRQLLLGEGGGR